MTKFLWGETKEEENFGFAIPTL